MICALDCVRWIVEDLEGEIEPFGVRADRVLTDLVVDAHGNDVHAARAVRSV